MIDALQLERGKWLSHFARMFGGLRHGLLALSVFAGASSCQPESTKWNVRLPVVSASLTSQFSQSAQGVLRLRHYLPGQMPVDLRAEYEALGVAVPSGGQWQEVLWGDETVWWTGMDPPSHFPGPDAVWWNLRNALNRNAGAPSEFETPRPGRRVVVIEADRSASSELLVAALRVVRQVLGENTEFELSVLAVDDQEALGMRVFSVGVYDSALPPEIETVELNLPIAFSGLPDVEGRTCVIDVSSGSSVQVLVDAVTVLKFARADRVALRLLSLPETPSGR